jgi:hypothetical protein
MLEVVQVTKWGLAATAVLCTTIALLAACGGGGDDDNNDDNGDGTRTATRASGTRTGTAVAGTGTPGASGTQASEGGTAAPGQTAPVSTPVPGSTQAAQATAGAQNESTPGSQPADPGDPLLSPAPTPTDAERNLAGGDEVDPELTGGSPDDERRVVTPLPDPPAGASIDPTTIADPQVNASGVEVIIDTNASEPGIQTTRSINVGDIVSVGVVVSNVPAEGLATFNFMLNYDIRAIVAPTVNGGSSLARNPDANEAGIGDAGWACSPPGPEGDADEPGLAGGDGDPTTGQAFISCYSTSGAPSASGDIVIATVRFQAVAAGTTTLSLGETAISAGVYEGIGNCEGIEPVVPCRTASITVN